MQPIRHPRENGDPVIAGKAWIPACAGMTGKVRKSFFNSLLESIRCYPVLIRFFCV
jgi:hypothetical protein